MHSLDLRLYVALPLIISLYLSLTAAVLSLSISPPPLSQHLVAVRFFFTTEEQSDWERQSIMSADNFAATKKQQSGEEFDHDGKKDDNIRKRRKNFSQGRRR